MKEKDRPPGWSFSIQDVQNNFLAFEVFFFIVAR
jgi:hypothetical protein